MGERGRRLHLALIVLVAFTAITAILSLNLLPPDIPNVSVGEISQADIDARSNLEFVNEQATKEAREREAEAVSTVYVNDLRVCREVEQTIAQVFSAIQRMQLERLAGTPEPKAQFPVKISEESLKVMLDVHEENLPILRTTTWNAVYRVMSQKIPDYHPDELRKRVAAVLKANPGNLPPPVLAAVTEIAQKVVRPSFQANFEATTKAKQEAMAQVEPVRTLITRGQRIVTKGSFVTPEQMAILEALGMHKRGVNLHVLMANALLVCLVVFVAGIYMAQQESPLLTQPRMLWLLVILVVSVLAMSRGGAQWSPFVAPIACASMLIALLIDHRLSLLVTALMSVCVGVINSDFGASCVCMITGLVAVLSVTNVTRRVDLMVASLVVWLVNVLSVLVVCLWSGNDVNTLLHNTLVYGTLNGLTASVVAMGALPFLEHIFNITTNIKLLEYSNASEPLLQRLMTEAPGTYAHSVQVGNLAEAATRAIGGDALLAKVGSYYHDIGKMKAAYFFVENQLGNENPHDRLTPSMSAHIIISHVNDGINLARAARLPQVIADFIDMHHGDRLVSYFYHKARQRGEEPLENHFRYQGRRPRTRETAIVMMADTIEAKARLLAKADQEGLEKLVGESIRHIMDEGQLDESPLSLRDIKSIGEAFVKTLMGIYHARIEYPSRASGQEGDAKPDCDPIPPEPMGPLTVGADVPIR